MTTTVGILGGGQLARMLALAGAPLGLRFRIVDSSDAACAGQVAPLLRADYTDLAALEGFAREVDVVTFDFENVPARTAEWLSQRVPVFPNPQALAIAQDRLEEKQLFRALGMGTPEFRAVDSRAALADACREIGVPAVLKTRRLGYDGKGQFRIRSAGDVDAAWSALGGVPLILEQFVAFEREVSVVAVRAQDGAFAAYPLTQNWHADGILSASLAPAPRADAIAGEATGFARSLAERLDYVGVFALELFVVGDTLLANEIAPRVHNSGHWTIEGAWVSQFENHLRAVLGLPLGATQTRGHAAMLNFVGELPERDPVLREAHAYWHDYGKSPRAARKVGHATLTAPDPDTLSRTLVDLGRALGRDAQVAPVLAALSS
ncbi:MAG TPA: 5-(carboxyamino)imidazole ribonucleotide synthase [Candidatus Saccharimonadia bacterium]|nr:5-(carboxyamino)imidazole ribonucleotide synthase [Candidatus Saccharimonadia bacterium]